MKLKGKISRSTNLGPQLIIDRLKKELDDEEYRILAVTDDSLEFDERPWKLMWSFEAVRRFDGGRFEIHNSDNLVVVTFIYYSNLLSTIVAFFFVSIIAFFNADYFAPLFFASFFIIAISIHFLRLKHIAKDMLADIVK